MGEPTKEARELLAAELRAGGHESHARDVERGHSHAPSALHELTEIALRAIDKALSTRPAPTEDAVEAVARAIHDARFTREPIWPWEDEDAGGKEYCKRLARATIAAMHHRERELREALKPFARVCDAYDYWIPDAMPDFSYPAHAVDTKLAREDCPTAIGQLTEDDFRRARAALQTKEDER